MAYIGNTPTERINKLLAEIEEARIFLDALWKIVQPYIPREAFAELPPAPTFHEYEKEKLRQQLTGAQTISKRKSAARRREANYWASRAQDTDLTPRAAKNDAARKYRARVESAAGTLANPTSFKDIARRRDDPAAERRVSSVEYRVSRDHNHQNTNQQAELNGEENGRVDIEKLKVGDPIAAELVAGKRKLFE